MSTTGITNYRDLDRGWRQWHRSEILASGGTGKYVPNLNDLVFDPSQGWFTVTEVDQTTGYSTLTPWFPPDQPNIGDNIDVLLGAGPGYSSESYRIFLDTSVTPHTFSPDKRLRFYGTSVHSYKVFLGSDISEAHGIVISTFFDTSGNFLGDSIPVETVPVYDAQGAVVPQLTVKAPMTGYCNRQLANGELVTLVGYSADGGVISIAQLLVKNTTAIRQHNASNKYVQGITIDTPFLSSADPNTIEFPINVTVESLPMTGVVHYSDGSRLRLPIDGNKFRIGGLRNYVATVVGQEFDLSLIYNLAIDEISYNLSPTINNVLTVPYTAKTVAADGSYEVKLYMYPVWVNATLGYRMEYWMYNLDRQTFYNVTPYIELGANSAAFNPLMYGTVQTITVAVDLNRVDGRFAPYRHVQTYQVALLARGDEQNANWEILFRADQQESYGRDLFADLEYVNVNFWRLRMGNGFASKEVWLSNMYEKIEPLYNEDFEAEAPVPTHFRVVFLNNTYEFSVDQWNDTLTVNNDLADGELVYIQWIRRNVDTDLQLGVSAVPARRRTT